MIAPVVSLKHSSSEPLVLLADIGFDAVRAHARRGKRRRARPSYARARAAGSRAYAHKCACQAWGESASRCVNAPFLLFLLWAQSVRRGAQLGQRIGVREFLPTQATATAAFGAVCVAKPWVCADAVGALCGYNPGNLSPARAPLRLAYMPAGALGARDQANVTWLGHAGSASGGEVSLPSCLGLQAIPPASDSGEMYWEE